MRKAKVKIGELNFELRSPEMEEEGVSQLEIENDASMVFETVDVEKARELRNLLDQYLSQASE